MKRIVFLFVMLYTFCCLAQLDSPEEPKSKFDYVYTAFKINYGLRPVKRESARIELEIMEYDNIFGSYIKDSFQLSPMNDMKGLSFGFEIGLDNKFFTDWMVDFVYRTRGKYNTNMFTIEGNYGYNYKLLQKYNVFIRPSFGLYYSRLNTLLGNYWSYNPYYEDLEVKQSSTIFGIRPRVQMEIPIYTTKGGAGYFIRFEAGWNEGTYLSRFIKLRARSTVPDRDGDYRYRSERFYLDGAKSNYYINGQHINKPPTSLGGYFIGVEVGVRFI